MAPFERDEAIARMSAFHDRLDGAASDVVRYAAVFADPPEGIGAHEIAAFRKADGPAVTMLVMVRLLRGPQGETRGIRTVMTEAPLGG